ncbi:hypothetical protein HYV12_01765 [Candidatus Dojkabacteria bacterium]|nr:hypothetical protein [Candidatus Dojkabacteria bacterium]
MEPKIKSLVILLAVLTVISLITSSTFGYLYFKEKSKYTSLKNSVEQKNNREEEKQGELDEGNGVQDDAVISRNIVCDGWMYADVTEGTVSMDIKYENKGEVSFENLNNACENIVMTYDGAKLFLTYSYGESYPTAFKAGTEVVTLKTVGDKVLGRQKYVEKKAATADIPEGYWLDYVALRNEATCTEVTDVFEAPGFPCFTGGNPFVTPAGNFSLFIPISKSTEEILNIVEFFDYVAKNSSYTIK